MTDVPTDWCEDCRHFLPKADASERYNPCQKGRVMEFWLPDDFDPSSTDDPYGFHRPGCQDRTPLPPDPPPPPPAPPPLTWDDPRYRMDPPPRGQGPRLVRK